MFFQLLSSYLSCCKRVYKPISIADAAILASSSWGGFPGCCKFSELRVAKYSGCCGAASRVVVVVVNCRQNN